MPTTISCTFTAISAGEGIFCIQARQEDGNKLALPSLRGFDLKPGTSFDTATSGFADHVEYEARVGEHGDVAAFHLDGGCPMRFAT